MRILLLAPTRLVLRVSSNILGFGCKQRVERQREGLKDETYFGDETSGLFTNEDLEGFCNRRVACLIATADVSFVHFSNAILSPYGILLALNLSCQ